MTPSARRFLAAVALALALSAPVGAQALLTPEEFEAKSTGRTLNFSRGGAPYGAEQYFEDRQVLWQYADGSCDRGYWYDDGDSLCFVYDAYPQPQCWVFEDRGGRFYARIRDLAAGDPSELLLSGESNAPLACPGPDLGS